MRMVVGLLFLYRKNKDWICCVNFLVIIVCGLGYFGWILVVWFCWGCWNWFFCWLLLFLLIICCCRVIGV